MAVQVELFMESMSREGCTRMRPSCMQLLVLGHTFHVIGVRMQWSDILVALGLPLRRVDYSSVARLAFKFPVSLSERSYLVDSSLSLASTSEVARYRGLRKLPRGSHGPRLRPSI